MIIKSVISGRASGWPHPPKILENLAPPSFLRSQEPPRNSSNGNSATRRTGIAARHFQPLQAAHAIAYPDQATSRGIQLAKRQSAACIEALNRIYQGIEPHSPARRINGNRPVELDVPGDLADGFRAFLTHPGHGSDHFKADGPTAQPNAHGTFTAGNSVAYSIHEMPHAPDRKRHLVITVGGLTAGTAVDPSTPGRALENWERTGNQALAIGRQSLGVKSEIEEFGEMLGEWMARSRRRDASLDFTVQGHSLGAVAAAKAFQACIEHGQPVKANFYNPAPLPVPSDPAAFARGVAQLGGERNLRKLAATFKSDRDPVEIIQRAPGARQLLHFVGANWKPDSFSTVYECVDDRLSGLQMHNHPARTIVTALNDPAPSHRARGGVPVSMGAAYLEQIAKANRLV